MMIEIKKWKIKTVKLTITIFIFQIELEIVKGS